MPVGYRAAANEQHKMISALGREMRKEFPDRKIPADVKFYEEAYKEPLVHLVVVLFRNTAKAYSRWHDALQNIPEKYRKELPYCVPTRDRADEVYVYPNVKYDISSIDDPRVKMKEITYALNTEIYLPFYDTFKAEKNDSKKAEKWSTFARGKKVVTRHDRMSIARVFTRFTSMTKDGVSDDKIRSFAETVQMDMQPVALTICDSPEKFIEMYSSGVTSCMSYTSEHAKKWSGLQDEGFHPAIFYYYHPNFGGAFIKRQGKVMARCVLVKHKTIPDTWQRPDGTLAPNDKDFKSFKFYSGIYPRDNSEFPKKLKALLEEAGLKPASTANVAANFDLPGIWSKKTKDYLAPVPYVDGRSGEAYATFDIPSKTFKCRAIQVTGSQPIGSYDTGGFKLAKEVLGACKCNACNASIKYGGEQYTTADGYTYCTMDCAQADGYFSMCDATGVFGLYKMTAHTMSDANEPTSRWLNREAFIEQGGLPALLTLGDTLDPKNGPMTIHGIKVKFNGVMCRIAANVATRIAKGKIDGASSQRDSAGDFLIIRFDKDAMEKARASRPSNGITW